MFVTNWISTTKIQKISEITNFFRHYFLSRTEVSYGSDKAKVTKSLLLENIHTKDTDKIAMVILLHGLRDSK